MVCRWLSIGPAFTVAAVAVALLITPIGAAWACEVRAICHHCA